MKLKFLVFLCFGLSVSACKLADLRTGLLTQENPPEDLEKKGRALLQEAVNAMGYQNLDKVQTYEARTHFKWRFPWSMMPMNAFPGSGRGGKKGHQFKFRPLSFDGTITYLDGRKAGDVHGLQSWKSYRQLVGKELEFKKDKKRTWGLATWHYLLEAPYRILKKAPIIKYAGTQELDGINYELVFATWGEEKPSKEFDHWLLFVHPETKFIDLAHVTVRDFFMPMPRNMALGVARYTHRQKTSEGIWFPESMILQLKKPKKEKRYVYQVQLSDFKFNTFPQEELYPDQNLRTYGDEKPESF